MAGKDQPQAEANVAMSPLPEFFINTPTTWFQQAEDRFAVARPALTSGQKYFQILGKLPQDLMVNFTDIIAHSGQKQRRPVHRNERCHLAIHN
jgi:hypothetical protein